MKKKILVVLLIIAQVCVCQEIDEDVFLVKSEVFVEKYSKPIFVDAFQDKEGNFGSVKYVEKLASNLSTTKIMGVVIQKWDNTGKTILNKTHSLKLKGESSIGTFLFKEGKFYVFECVKNRKKKTLDYYVHILDDEKQIERKKVLSVAVNKFPKKNIKRISHKYDSNYSGGFLFSKNGKYIAYSIDAAYKDKETHKVFVFNNNLELLWQKEFTHDKEDEFYSLYDTKVSNNGEIYMLGRAYNNPVKREINKHHELFKVTKEKEESVKLNISNVWIKNMQLEQTDNEITCVGLFSKVNRYEIKGVAFFKLDKSSMTIMRQKKETFSQKLFFDKYGTGTIENLLNYGIRNLVRLKNGDYIITAEEMNYSFGEYGTTSYSFDDIIVTRLSKDGDLIWSRNINKKNRGRKYDGKLSYKSIINENGDVYLFLNAHKIKEGLEGERLIFKSGILGLSINNSKLYSVRLKKEDGSFDVNVIQENKNSEMLFDLQNGKELNKNKVVFFGIKDKNSQITTIELK